MLGKIDRIFGVFLLIGAAGHIMGTLLLLPAMSEIWVWSLGAAIAAALLGVLNIVRAGRANDKTIAVITTIGTAIWALLALTFGASIHNLLDPRALFHFVVSAVLVVFGFLTIRNAARY